MRVALVVACVLALAVAANCKPINFTSCDSNSQLKVTTVDASPYPPKIGQDATITVTGTLGQQVTGGNYTVTVNLFGIPLASFTGGICELTTCPIHAGTINLSKTLNIPAFAPPGTFDIQVKATNQDHNSLVCVALKVTLSGALADEEVVEQEEDEEADSIEMPQKDIPFSICEQGTHFTPTNVDANPFPPVKGKQATVTVSGKLDEQVTGGDYTITVIYGGFPLNTLTGQLCELAACPLKAGNIKLSKSLDIPSFAPPGQYTVNVKANDQNHKHLVCLAVSLNIAALADETAEEIAVEIVEAIAPVVVREELERENEVQRSVPFTSCPGSHPFSANTVDVDPWPVKIGSTANVAVTGKLASDVSSGSYTIETSLFGIVINTQAGDICDLAACPIKAGTVKLHKSLAVPSIAPPGSYTVTVKAVDSHNKDIACLQVPVTISALAEDDVAVM